ncbi:MAG: long-chain fatty acid--CoA ligase [Leptospiraceae bacterium]|nr:long-chain fatty acid--CoA ligase [Leptospiraceae bacterium]MCP5497552.1 long-chain fatty acid--CoA ligase [Leptospiraceae bacterium]
MESTKNLAEVIRKASEKYANEPSFFSKDEKKNYKSVTFKELYDLGISLSEALIDMGLQAKEHVGLMADHRLEWAIADIGVVCSGAADVPRGTDVTEKELEYILTHSGAKIVFIEHDKMLDKFNKVKSKVPNVKTIIMMDPKSTATGVLKLYDLIENGKKLREGGSKKAEERIEKIQPDDLFTLIYTSGTTGDPKGVMLMHSNMMHQMKDVSPRIHITHKDKFLSILPVWHIFERLLYYISFYYGVSTYFTNVRDLRDDFAKAHPTFMASAPRLWESIYLGIYNRLNDPKLTPPIRKTLFDIAYFYSKNYHGALRFLKGNEVDYVGRNPIVSLGWGLKSILALIFTGPFTMSIVSFLAAIGLSFIPPLSIVLIVVGVLGLVLNNFVLDKIVLSKIRLATGGHLKATLSGGGALQRHVDEFFNDIGLNVIEGYGMTETTPVIAHRSFEHLVMGSVGVVAPKSTLQLRDFNNNLLTTVDGDTGKVTGQKGVKGIIFIKGPQVMKGYYKNEEATKKTIGDDGFLNTGDLGMINFKNTLTITGRAKETIVLLGGENVEPVPIENKICESPYIAQCMVVGQDQKTLGAIIIPDFDKLKEWCKENGVTETDPAKLIQDPNVTSFYKKEIKNHNSVKTGFKSFEQVADFFLITKPFEVGDELTNLLKMKRHIITQKYEDKIKKLYS